MSTQLHELVLDCRPGGSRPNDVLKIIIANMELCEEDFTVTSKSFGAWTFRVSAEKDEYYTSQLEEIIKRVTGAYKSGIIRYAEW